MSANRITLTPINISDHVAEKAQRDLVISQKKDTDEGNSVENQALFDEFNPKIKSMVMAAYRRALIAKKEGQITRKYSVVEDIIDSLYTDALAWVEKNDPTMVDRVSDLPAYIKWKLYSWTEFGMKKSKKPF